MTETETEQERKVREYWAAAYNNDNHNKQAGLPLQYEPTAVLTSQRQRNSSRKTSIYDILGLYLRSD